MARSGTNLLRLARLVSPDPFADEVHRVGRSVRWLYGPEQYELGVLERLVSTGFAANRFVHYAANFGRAANTAHFRLSVPGAVVPLRLRVADDLEVTIGQQPVTTVRDDEGWWVVQLPPVEAAVDFRVTAQSGPATIGVPADAGPNSAVWLVRSEEDWSIPGVRTGALKPPHQVGEPVQPLAARRVRDGLYDLSAPALGHVVIRSASKPALRTGESVNEAQSGLQAESREDLDPLGCGRWRSRHRLGLRYLAVGEAETTGVVIEAEIRSAPRRGAFVCSDERLNRIWAVSAYTLRLCMQRLMIDGIKRDRMPWAGDQALSTLANAYAFGDETIATDSSVASGRPRHGYINGISDYSLWWVINNGLLARYFGSDGETSTRRARNVQRLLEDLTRYVGDDSVFRPQIEADGFGTSAGSVFLDWGITVDGERDLTALQMLWIWALRSAADLLAGVGHQGAAKWRRMAQRSIATVTNRAWDADRGAWRKYLDHRSGSDSAYPNFLAVLSGISRAPAEPGIRAAIVHGDVGTPFMTAFALRAQGLVGDRQGAVQRIRNRWGAMLDAGALTFWEDFATPATRAPDDRYAMYGRPFGKSLCHAWSAGPAALLPELVLGVRPLADGWSRFTVAPEPGDLEWAGAVVPVPHGRTIVASVDRGEVSVEVPRGLVLERPDGQEVAGPARADWTVG